MRISDWSSDVCSSDLCRRTDLSGVLADMNEKLLNETALAMVAAGKGILAADESTGTIEKRFTSIKVENTEPTRKTYRDMPFTTQGLEKYTSGVILFEEALFPKDIDGSEEDLRAWKRRVRQVRT